MSQLTPNRVPLRSVQNLTPTQKFLNSGTPKRTPKTSPGPALLQAIYLSSSKKILSPPSTNNIDSKTPKSKLEISTIGEHDVPYFRYNRSF